MLYRTPIEYIASRTIVPLHNLPQLSTFLVIQTKFWYILGYPNPTKGYQVRHILIIFSIFLFSLTIISCSSSSDVTSSSTSTDVTSPTVSFTSPADNQSGVAISDSITVTFSEGMDTTTITTNTSDTTCSGTIQVSSYNFQYCVKMSSSPSSSNSDKTYTVDPSENLSYSTTYKIRVTTGVKDSSGDAMLSQYETSSGFIVAAALPAYITSMVEVEGGNNFSCSRKSDGTVWCWGSDASGQLGDGDFHPQELSPERLIT